MSRVSLSDTISEILFVVLPLLVLSLVLASKGHADDIRTSAEWSFGASVLFGQLIVKFVKATSTVRGFTGGSAIVLISAAVVFGLVPSLVILSIILIIEPNTISAATSIGHLCLFGAGIVLNLFFGSVLDASS